MSSFANHRITDGRFGRSSRRAAAAAAAAALVASASSSPPPATMRAATPATPPPAHQHPTTMVHQQQQQQQHHQQQPSAVVSSVPPPSSASSCAVSAAVRAPPSPEEDRQQQQQQQQHHHHHQQQQHHSDVDMNHHDDGDDDTGAGQAAHDGSGVGTWPTGIGGELMDSSAAMEEEAASVGGMDDGCGTNGAKTAAQNAILKTALERQIAERHPSIKIIRPRPNTKSDVWCHDFYRLVFRNGKKQNFILCIECERVITYKSKQGTGSLLRHRCFRDRKKMEQQLALASAGVLLAAASAGVSAGNNNNNGSGGVGNGSNGCDNGMGVSDAASAALAEAMSAMAAEAGDAVAAAQAAAAQAPSDGSSRDRSRGASNQQRREELRQLIEAHDPCIEIRDTEREGFVWSFNNFKNIYRNGQRQSFILCITCREVIAYPRSRGGISSLLKHPCFSELTRVQCDNDAIVLSDLIAKNDPSIKLKLPSNLLVAREFRIIFRFGMKMEYVLCIVCNQLIKGCTITTLLAHRCVSIQAMQQQLEQQQQMQQQQLAAAAAAAVDMHGGEDNDDDEDDDDNDHDNDADDRQHRSDEAHHQPAAIKEERIASPVSNLSLDAMLELTKCQMDFITDTMLPARVIETPEFQQLAQLFVRIGANYGQVNVADLLLSRQQLLAERTRMLSAIHANLHNIIGSYHLAYACDMWHDANRNKYYLALAGHYIDERFERQRCVFGVRAVSQMETQNEELVRRNVVEILRACSGHASNAETERFIAKSVIVTNMMYGEKAERFTAIACAATNLADIVADLLADPLLEVTGICLQIREIYKSLAKTMTSSAEQWIVDEFDPHSWAYVWKLLNRCTTIGEHMQNASDLLSKIHVVTNMLQPFQQASLSLSCASTPTINQVYVFRKKLEDVFVLPFYNEPAAITQMKTKARELVMERFAMGNLHKLAVFLDPRFKSLRFMSDTDRTAVITMTKKLIAGGGCVDAHAGPMAGSHKTHTRSVPGGGVKPDAGESEYLIEYMDEHFAASGGGGGGGGTTGSGSAGGCSSAGKGAATGGATSHKSQYLMEYMDDHADAAGAPNEVDVYLNLKLNNSAATDVLQFWKQRTDLKQMRELARAILCIPACSSAAACLFVEESAQLARNRLAVDADDLAAALLINGNARSD